MGKSPGFAKKPDYKLSVEAAGKRVRVTSGGETIADSTNANAMFEGDHPPVYYVPRDDARMDLLQPTDTSTHCPFKGDASYYSAVTSSGEAVDAIWSYEDPFEEMAEIAGHLAFYPDRVDAIEVTDG